jgi:Tfp pilus assembly protein PilN
MIKVNLASRKQSVSANAGKGKPISFNSSDILKNINFEKLKNLPIRKVVLPIIVLVGAFYMAQSYEQDELRKLETRLQNINSENGKIQAEVDKLKGYDVVKKSLEQDEATIRSKLDTIQKLIADRSTSFKVLLSIVDSIPKDAWLTEYRIEQMDISLKGSSLNFGLVSDFMKNLHESAFLASVDLVDTQEAKDHIQGSANFELRAKRR